ncbi:Long chain acyl-CoA synthetase 2 [Glycine soja]
MYGLVLHVIILKQEIIVLDYITQAFGSCSANMEHNLTHDFKSLCDNLKARKHILDELNSTVQKHQLRGFELLKAIHLEPNPFDIERDLITPTFKLKRPKFLKYYKDHIDQLYKEAKGALV